MNYAAAKAIAEARGLVVAPDSGLRHIDVSKVDGGQHFSIALPTTTAAVPRTEEEQEATLIDSINEAVKYLPPV